MEKLRQIALLALSLTLAIAFTLAASFAHERTATAKAVVVGTPVSLGEIVVEGERSAEENEAVVNVNKDEILWMARGIYSETKRPDEQELVAWTIRNRAETGYRGKRTFKTTVLDPWQYSAFNRNSPKRTHYSSLTERSNAPGFKAAIGIAERVAMASVTARPFPPTTRHFYSERSMVGGKTPAWAVNKVPVKLDRNVDPRRFRFYAGIA
jgi:hypothetical protein